MSFAWLLSILFFIVYYSLILSVKSRWRTKSKFKQFYIMNTKWDVNLQKLLTISTKHLVKWASKNKAQFWLEKFCIGDESLERLQMPFSDWWQPFECCYWSGLIQKNSHVWTLVWHLHQRGTPPPNVHKWMLV